MDKYSCDRCGKLMTPNQHFRYGADVQYAVRDSSNYRPKGWYIKRCKLCVDCRKQLKQFMLGKSIEHLNIIRNEEDNSDDTK